jgi:hypothetical protein
MSILDLPDELLVLICEHVWPDASTAPCPVPPEHELVLGIAPFVRLRRACRRFAFLATARYLLFLKGNRTGPDFVSLTLNAAWDGPAFYLRPGTGEIARRCEWSCGELVHTKIDCDGPLAPGGTAEAEFFCAWRESRPGRKRSLITLAPPGCAFSRPSLDDTLSVSLLDLVRVHMFGDSDEETPVLSDGGSDEEPALPDGSPDEEEPV